MISGMKVKTRGKTKHKPNHWILSIYEIKLEGVLEFHTLPLKYKETPIKICTADSFQQWYKWVTPLRTINTQKNDKMVFSILPVLME